MEQFLLITRESFELFKNPYIILVAVFANVFVTEVIKMIFYNKTRGMDTKVRTGIYRLLTMMLSIILVTALSYHDKDAFQYNFIVVGMTTGIMSIVVYEIGVGKLIQKLKEKLTK